MTSGGTGRSLMAVAALALAAFGGSVSADPSPSQSNMHHGARTWLQGLNNLNNIALDSCLLIGIVVIVAIFVSMFRFRNSRGAGAEKWPHHTFLEIIWTAIPLLILVVLAYFATGGLAS